MSAFWVSLPCYLYACWRLDSAVGVLAPDAQRSLRWAYAAVGLWFAAFPFACRWAYAERPSGLVAQLMNGHPTTDFLLAYPFWVTAVFLGQILPYLVTVDVAFLGARLFDLLPDISAVAWRANVTVWLLALGLLLVVARASFDTRTVRTRVERISIPDLPDDLDGFRIAHISDIQADPRTDDALLSRFTDAVNAARPDVVMFAGDLVTRGTEHVRAGVRCVEGMRAEHGAFGCLGDHDIWSAPRMVTEGLASVGMRLVTGGSEEVRVGNGTIGVSVVTNAYSNRPDLEWDLPAPGGDVSILLTHQPSPDVVSAAADRGYDLMLAGHTHGGQVNLNWFGKRMNASSFETPYVSGIHRVGEMHLSVTNGLGLTLSPIRYVAPAEVTLIVLSRP